MGANPNALRAPQPLGGVGNVSNGQHPGNLPPLSQTELAGIGNVQEDGTADRGHQAPKFNPTVQAGSVPYGADKDIGYAIIGGSGKGGGAAKAVPAGGEGTGPDGMVA